MNQYSKKFILTILIFSSVAVLPMSCDTICNNPCGCGASISPKDFEVQSFKILNLDIDGNQIGVGEYLSYDQVTKTILIDGLEPIASIQKKPSSSIPGLAFACSPVPPKSAQKLIDIQIFNTKEVTLGDGETLQVGQNISSYFGINYLFNESLSPISKFLENGLTFYGDDHFKLQFQKDPQQETELEISIQILLEQGLEFNFQNEVLRIR